MKNIWDEKVLISPSLITLDMMNLQDQIRELELNGADMIHVDLLDGHFSPSMPLGFETVAQLRSITNLPLDCHIMSDIPDFYVEELLRIGVQQIVFHIENAQHPDGLINYIKSKGVRAGVALKPSTSLSTIEYIIEKCDCILLMQINPGYASVKGEKLIPYIDRKIKDLRKMITQNNLNTKISIDGRVSLDIIEKYRVKYVDIFVVGTTCLSRIEIPKSMAKINELKIIKTY
jgi:ribulose-phosphate 3-epimerase